MENLVDITQPVDVLDDPKMMIAALKNEIFGLESKLKKERNCRIIFILIGLWVGAIVVSIGL